MNQRNSTGTLKDIAKEAGVSMQAVSLVLRGKGKGQVSKANTEKIRAAAEKLNYRSNIYAIRMRNSRSDGITLVIDDMRENLNRYYDFQSGDTGPLTRTALIETAAEQGFEIKHLPLPSSAGNPAEFIRNNVGFPYSDGVLFYGYYYLKDIYPVILRQSLPCLGMIPFTSLKPQLPYISYDFESGYRQLVRWLYGAGCRRFVFGTYALTSPGVCARFDIFRAAVAEIMPEGRPTAVVSKTMPELRREVAEFVRLWDYEGRQPTAVACFTPRLAGCWKYELEYLGIDVGKEIMTACLEDCPHYPEIPSVRLPFLELGRVAANEMIRAIRSKTMPGPQPIILPVGLNLPQDLIHKTNKPSKQNKEKS